MKQIKRTKRRTAKQLFSSALVLNLVLILFASMAYDTGATDLDHGWAIIVGPGNAASVHQKEAENLYSYLVERGWDENRIILLSEKNKDIRDGTPTKDEFVKAMNYVNKACNGDEVVFIAVMDHAVEGDDGDYFLRFGKQLDEYMSNTEFGECLDKIQNYRAMVVDIAGPYSGGFISLAIGDERLIVSDCSATEWYKKSEYSFYEALTDMDADLDGDKKVSVEEAHAYMIASMEKSTPQIEDPDVNNDFMIPEY